MYLVIGYRRDAYSLRAIKYKSFFFSLVINIRGRAFEQLERTIDRLTKELSLEQKVASQLERLPVRRLPGRGRRPPDTRAGEHAGLCQPQASDLHQKGPTFGLFCFGNN